MSRARSFFRDLRSRAERSGRLRRPGVARPCRIVRRCRLRHGYMLHIGTAICFQLSWRCWSELRRWLCLRFLSLRSTGIGFIMITLALGQILWGLAYRWISVTAATTASLYNAGRAIRFRSQYGKFVLLHDAGHLCDRDGLCCDLRALSAWRRLDGHTRPAAPHERSG